MAAAGRQTPSGTTVRVTDVLYQERGEVQLRENGSGDGERRGKVDKGVQSCGRTSNTNPRREIPKRRPRSAPTAAHVKHCKLKSRCPGARAWTYHLCADEHTSMSPSSRPIATVLEYGSAAMLLIGDGFQSPNAKVPRISLSAARTAARNVSSDGLGAPFDKPR